MSAPLTIVKPGVAGLASYDKQGRWIVWAWTEVDKVEGRIHDFFESLGWRWIENGGVWFDEEGNPTVAYLNGEKVEYPMERWP